MVRKLDLHLHDMRMVYSLCVDKVLWEIRSCVNLVLNDALAEGIANDNTIH